MLALLLQCALMASLAQSAVAPYEAAMSSLRTGNFSQAIAILEPLAVSSPGDLRVRNLLGIALSQAGRREEAIQQFRKALEWNPSFIPALKNMALNELALSRTAEAKRHFSEVFRLAPSDPAAHMGLAQIDFAEQRFDAAIVHFQESGALYLNDSRALLNYAASCVEAGQSAKALDLLTRLPPDSDPGTHFEAGLLLARLERFEAASREFELARGGSLDPYQVDFNLCLAYLKGANYPAAAKTAEAMISAGRSSSEVYSLLAEALDASGKTDEAYKALQDAAQRFPRDETPYLELIALCAEHEKFDLGLKIADSGVRMIPASIRLLIQRGIVLAMMARFKEAEADLNRSAEIAPTDTMAIVAINLLRMRTERVGDAVQDLRKRQRENPEDYLLNWMLAEALTRNGSDAGEAISALETSIRLNPDVAQSRLLLGKLLLTRGQTDQAIQHLKKALELDPASVTATYQLAQAYRKKGDAAQANALFAKVGKMKSEGADELTHAGLLRLIRQRSR